MIKTDNLYKGVLYLLLATFTFSLVNLGVKLLSGPTKFFPDVQEFPVYELVFFRSIISLSICITIVKMRKIPFLGNNKLWLFIRGFCGATGLFLFFMTIQELPMAIATIVQYLSPVFTIIIAIFLLNEKVKWIQWLFFAVSLSGIFVIGFDSDDTGKITVGWLMIGIISSLFSGMAYNAIM